MSCRPLSGLRFHRSCFLRTYYKPAIAGMRASTASRSLFWLNSWRRSPICHYTNRSDLTPCHHPDPVPAPGNRIACCHAQNRSHRSASRCDMCIRDAYVQHQTAYNSSVLVQHAPSLRTHTPSSLRNGLMSWTPSCLHCAISFSRRVDWRAHHCTVRARYYTNLLVY